VKITKPEQQYRQKAKEAKTVETHQAQGAFSSAGQGPRQVQGGGDTAPVTVRRQNPKVGRNDPCPCGSGKKYKYCCGRNAYGVYPIKEAVLRSPFVHHRKVGF